MAQGRGVLHGDCVRDDHLHWNAEGLKMSDFDLHCIKRRLDALSEQVSKAWSDAAREAAAAAKKAGKAHGSEGSTPDPKQMGNKNYSSAYHHALGQHDKMAGYSPHDVYGSHPDYKRGFASAKFKGSK